jgi:hypothetical protein
MPIKFLQGKSMDDLEEVYYEWEQRAMKAMSEHPFLQNGKWVTIPLVATGHAFLQVNIPFPLLTVAFYTNFDPVAFRDKSKPIKRIEDDHME